MIGHVSVHGADDAQVIHAVPDMFEDLTPTSRRRTIYGFIDRQNLPGVYRTFDFANPDIHSPQRHETTTPQQALFLLNSPFLIEVAQHLARRPEVSSQPDPTGKIRMLYRLAYQREPTDSEIALGLRYVTSAQDRDAAAGAENKPQLGPWERYAQVLLIANEFMFVD